MDCCPQRPKCLCEEDDKISNSSTCSSQFQKAEPCRCVVEEKESYTTDIQSEIEPECECYEKHERSYCEIEPECISHEKDKRSSSALSEIERACGCCEEEENSVRQTLSPTLSKIASSASLSSIASFPEYDLKPNISISEIKRRLGELIDMRGPNLVQACRNFDRRATGKILKTHFRQVLRTFCFPITVVQFDLLLKELNLYQSGKINYMDFFSNLMSGKNIAYEKPSERLENVPLDEVELRIKKKITPKIRDVIRSFWLFDVNKDGLIQKSELRRIIKNYCFDFSEHLFDELWKVHDPKGKGTINYKDFLIKLGIDVNRYMSFVPSETVARALCWSEKNSTDLTQDINFDQRTRRAALENKDDPAIIGLPLEEIVTEFNNRLYHKSKLLKKIFNVFDNEKNGGIALSDFHGIINFYLMPLSVPLFHQVMKRLGVCLTPCSIVNYENFLEKFNQSRKKPFKSTKLDCLSAVQHIKNHVLNPRDRFHSILTGKSGKLKEQITRNELRRAVRSELKLHLSDEDFKDLLEVLDPGNTNIIQCKSFLNLFECPEKECSVKESCCSLKCSPEKEKYVCLKGDKLKSKFKHHFNKVYKDVEKAIFICDPNQSGFITEEKLKKIFNGLCFPLTDEQFQEIVCGFRTYGDSLNYREFLNGFLKKPGEDTEKWIAKVNKLVTYKSRCPPELPVDEAEEMLKECVQSRKSAMLRDFKTLDVCNVGVICKDDVRNVLNKFSFRLNDKQFHELWKKFPRNKFNQLLYDKFLEEYCTSKAQHKPHTNDLKGKAVVEDANKPESVCATSHFNLRKKQETINRKSAKEILFTQAPHLKKTIEAVEPVIIRNIRTIRYHLHRADLKLSGVVTFKTLIGILEKSGIRLSPDEEFYILEYFDKTLSGKIPYKEFLQIFVWHA